MNEHYIYPVSQSNQISLAYYQTVVQMQNTKTTNLRVTKVIHHNGSYAYETYHLITSL